MLVGLLARLVSATSLVDRAFRFFDRARSRVVLALASDAFLEHYNDLSYGTTDSYRADSSLFQPELYSFEKAALEQFFPRPPARVIIGGAGGGREALALRDLGYDVVAFDPSVRLLDSMRARLDGGNSIRGGPPLTLLRGRYQDLPTLASVPGGRPVDLSGGRPFDGAILGWTSISHVRSDGERIAALQQMAALTRGPILVSYLGRIGQVGRVGQEGRVGQVGRVGRGRWLRDRGPYARFSVQIGYYWMLSAADIEGLAAAAGLKVLKNAPDADWPHAVLMRA